MVASRCSQVQESQGGPSAGHEGLLWRHYLLRLPQRAMDAPKPIGGGSMPRIIGAVTRYEGTEHSFMSGLEVRIVAVLKGTAAPSRDPDAEYPYLRDDEDVVYSGGVTEHDRLEVQPWIEEEGRFSFVTSDARAVDLVGLLAATVQ